MQLASRNPFSGQISCKVYWPTPFKLHFDFRPLFRTNVAELSRKYPYSQTPAGGALKEKRRPGALVFGSRKASL